MTEQLGSWAQGLLSSWDLNADPSSNWSCSDYGPLCVSEMTSVRWGDGDSLVMRLCEDFVLIIVTWLSEDNECILSHAL